MEALNEAAGNHGPSAAQGPTTKQHAIEVLKYTPQFSSMINNENNKIVALIDRNPKLQK